MAWATIKEATQRLGLSDVTIRRRLRAGSLVGRQEFRPQGYVWLVEVPDSIPAPEESQEQEVLPGEIAVQRELVATLQEQLHSQALVHQDQLAAKDHQLEAREREVQELHVLLQQSQEQANRLLPPPRQRHWWWPFS